ncbi:methyltransferase type 11 [Blastococcus sp. TBT05-19]|uniref:class I SAM-dependent methyltransferase n=1 Tax=Blastococcus sp. TBT05-19 TaxID=2250581 RepID=UPI000DEA5017|nr:methyltransferase domain-containing protein [Blastococcus sp. TBT05-19]RBY88920.1 methyltransferase type 11 [Blastococcus sp. TBT05-19]
MPTVPASPTAAQLPVRTAAVWAALDPLVGAGTPLRVLDVGGGSGVFAVPLARLGHTVTVVDPSADALATLSRRAQTDGVGERVVGVQGDGDLLHEVLADDDGGYDLALCHSVLEVVDDPAVTLREIAGALRPGGQVSLAVANRAGGVLARAIAGQPTEALAVLRDQETVTGRAGRRRFTHGDLLVLVDGAGLTAGEWRGVSVVADLLEAASGADAAAVRSLELALAGTSPYREIAAGLHLLATRP